MISAADARQPSSIVLDPVEAMNFALKMREIVFKTRNCVLKTRNCVLKMMDFAGHEGRYPTPGWLALTAGYVNSVFKMMNFVFKMMNFVSKMMMFGFKTMDFEAPAAGCTTKPQLCPSHPGVTFCKSDPAAGQCDKAMPHKPCPACPPPPLARDLLLEAGVDQNQIDQDLEDLQEGLERQKQEVFFSWNRAHFGAWVSENHEFCV